MQRHASDFVCREKWFSKNLGVVGQQSSEDMYAWIYLFIWNSKRKGSADVLKMMTSVF